MLRRLRIENLVLIREAELELGPGLNVLSGETGAGKTIFAQAIGLLLGVKGDAGGGRPGRDARRTWRPSSTCPTGSSTTAASSRSPSCGPRTRPGLVLARRVFADGRTRAYAWGRAIAREDLAAATERLIAMSGQFEQRRLARPAYQLDVLDAFVGEEQAARGDGRARPGGRSPPPGAAATRPHATPARRPPASRRCATSSSAPRGSSRARRTRCGPSESACVTRPSSPRARRRATAAVAPDDGDGAASLAAAAERALAPLTRLAPELEGPASELRELAVRLSEVGSDLHRFVASLDADPAPGRGGRGPPRPASPELRRRFGAQTLEELLERRDAAADRARRARRRPRPGRRRCARSSRAPRSSSSWRPPRCEPRGRRRPSRSPPPWRRTSTGSGWARASSGSSCASASRARAAATRPCS